MMQKACRSKRATNIRILALNKSNVGKFFLEDIIMLTKQFQALGFGYNYRALLHIVRKITFCGIRFKFREFAPDSGQQHTTNSDNRFL